MKGHAQRNGALLVVVLAALLLLAVVVTLIARSAVLSGRALDSAAAVMLAESAWVAAAERVRAERPSDAALASDLQIELPGQGPQRRTATVATRKADEGWEIEVTLEQNGRVIARRRGTVLPVAQPAAASETADRASEGETS